jgi:glycosyltransferase involved in cell wall biosynthesis
VRILIVSAQFPYPPRSGFAMRVVHLARRLAERHEVTLLSYATAEEAAGGDGQAGPVRVVTVARDGTSTRHKRVAQALSLASPRPFSCRSVASPAMQRAIDELCAGEAFDAIQLETSLLCTFRFPRGSRLVLDEHNIEYEVHQRTAAGERSVTRRLFHRLEGRRLRRYEQRCWSRVDACMVTSERELPIVRRHAGRIPVGVVPNGVDIEYFEPGAGDIRARTVVFNGILTYRPNVDAAEHLVDEIWPRVLRRHPDARLTLVGRASEEDRRRLTRPGVVVTGEVPDIRPYLREAAVVAVPVRIGGGTRLKVVEGLASGKAMVSTSLGCEGIDVRDGEHLLIGDGAEGFAARVIELFDDPGKGEELGRAGRALVERAYSWDLVGRRMETVYAEMLLRAPYGRPRRRRRLAPGLPVRGES